MARFTPMGVEDRAAYEAYKTAMLLASQAKPRQTALDKPITKLEAARMGKAMILACSKGDADEAAKLLRFGAQVNARDADGQSCLAIALERCGKGVDMRAFALEALGLGALVAPARYSGFAADFTEYANQGGEPSDKLRSECVQLTLEAFCAQSQDWPTVHEAFAQLRPPLAAGIGAMAMLARNGRLDLMAQGVAQGTRCKESDFQALMERAQQLGPVEKAQGLFSKKSIAPFQTLLMSLATKGELSGKIVEDIYEMAAQSGSAQGILALMEVGAKPEDGWVAQVYWTERVGYREHRRGERASLLVAAAASHSGRGAFDAVAMFPPAVEQARISQTSPALLAQIPIARLLELSQLGVDIASQDLVGGVAHWWAKLDDKPRDGWATLAAKAPAVFETSNTAGVKAADAMAAKLHGKDKDAFYGSLARMESREIKKVAKAPQPVKNSSPRPRL